MNVTPDCDWITSSDRPCLFPDDLRASADLVIVGLGMSRQERRILDHLALVPPVVFVNVRGCLDYLAGRQRLAPRWLAASGLERLYWLVYGPKRLERRYFVESVLPLLPAVIGNRGWLSSDTFRVGLRMQPSPEPRSAQHVLRLSRKRVRSVPKKGLM